MPYCKIHGNILLLDLSTSGGSRLFAPSYAYHALPNSGKRSGQTTASVTEAWECSGSQESKVARRLGNGSHVCAHDSPCPPGSRHHVACSEVWTVTLSKTGTLGLVLAATTSAVVHVKEVPRRGMGKLRSKKLSHSSGGWMRDFQAVSGSRENQEQFKFMRRSPAP